MFHTHTTELTIMPPTKGPFMTVEVGPNTRWTSVAILLVFTSRLVDVSFGKAFFKTHPVVRAPIGTFPRSPGLVGFAPSVVASITMRACKGFNNDGPTTEDICAGPSLIEAIVPPNRLRRRSSWFETPESIATVLVPRRFVSSGKPGIDAPVAISKVRGCFSPLSLHL